MPNICDPSAAQPPPVAVWQWCYLGLGANLATEQGTPTQHVQRAIAQLGAHPHLRRLQASDLYVSRPLGPQDQPDFINAVVGAQTTLSAFALLSLCQQLEQDAGRVRVRHWGERSLDVDVLYYADMTIQTPQLTLPHPHWQTRNFVVVPWQQLTPDLCVNGVRIDQCSASDDHTGLRRLQPNAGGQ